MPPLVILLTFLFFVFLFSFVRPSGFFFLYLFVGTDLMQAAKCNGQGSLMEFLSRGDNSLVSFRNFLHLKGDNGVEHLNRNF